jgi:phosphoribosylformimino-5-aminoimidazole carboxamide ribotide isomerase
MRIIPAIDLLEGKCVRLFKGDYNQVEVFHEDPVKMAIELEQAGFKYLHLVDLDGARNSGNNQGILQEITKNTLLTVDFGGGLRGFKAVDEAINKGAHQVNIGSMAVKDKKEFLRCLDIYGDQIIWNADLKNGKLAVNGWQDTVENDFDELVKEFSAHGLRQILSTDISKDGTLEGPNFELYRKLINDYPRIGWIASGGISTASDVEKLKKDGLDGAVIGKALYKGTITYKELLTIQHAD